MSFRRRNVGLTPGALGRDRPGDGSSAQATTSQSSRSAPVSAPGVRPSPVDGRPTTSTGTQTLDDLLAGHAGLALGTSLLVEENGTTDYAGVLLKYYAAEGVVQGHHVHVVGLPEPWGRELPGLIEGRQTKERPKAAENEEKMKIAWRYEKQSHLLEERSGRRGPELPLTKASGADGDDPHTPQVFCHTFDLTKRLVHPTTSNMSFYNLSMRNSSASPFAIALETIISKISSSSPSIVHRILVPSLLSPVLYPPYASQPQFALQFLHGIRALLSTHPDRVTAMLSLPLSLYPRATGLTRWMEILSDGVIELSPFPHSSSNFEAAEQSKPGQDEQPQGLLTVHRLPILHERGGGSGAVSEESAFTLTRKRFTIKPFSLPPVEGDTEAQQERSKKADIDF